MPKERPDLLTTAAGVPIPWVAMAKTRSFTGCLKTQQCWICGEKLGIHLAFVTPIAAAFSLLDTHPPAHTRCAELMQEQQQDNTLLWVCRAPASSLTRFEDGITNTFQVLMPTPMHCPIWRRLGGQLIERAESIQLLQEAYNTAAPNCQSPDELLELQNALMHAIDHFTPDVQTPAHH
jgi:hypothetical protein